MINSPLLRSVVSFTLFSFLFGGGMLPAFAQLESDTAMPDTVYADIKQQVQNTQQGLPPEGRDPFRWNVPIPILSIEQNGGFFSFGSGFDEYGLDVLTGKDSIYESMQLGDFTSAFEIDRQLLENLEAAIGVFLEEVGVYPESLTDFAAFEGEWWAGIEFDGERRNIAKMTDIFEYKAIKEKAEERDFVCAGQYQGLSREGIDAAPQEYVEKVRNESPEMCKTLAEVLAGNDCCLYMETEVTSYTVSLKQRDESTFPVGNVKTVESKSHEFTELIEAEGITAEVPEIASIVPADSFLIHFDDAEKYGELSGALSNQLAEVGQFLPVPTPEKFEQMIAKRLGIPDPVQFLATVQEFAFVGEDIRLFPKADYAVIVKWKNKGAGLLAKLLETGENRFGEVGDYFVFATSEELFNDIAALESGTSNRKALAEEQDYYYSLGVTEQNRDGFVFFSDAFIRKLVSPEYRIGLRRQKTVLSAMNTLQYVVWAYKDLEGNLPKSFREIADKGYIREEGIYEIEEYSIDNEGIVHHETWGTPFNVTPVTRVPVEAVSEREKVWYEEQRDMYESSYRQFFDPVGISIAVADKILFHTVILPLAETREYDMLRSLVGTKQKESFALLRGNRSIFQGALAFDFDNFVYRAIDVYDSAKMKATDSIRQNDLLSIRSAIEQYFGDNGYYPESLDELVTDYYMQRIPNDPSGDEYGYQLFENSSREKDQCYRIFARLTESNKMRMENDNGIDPNLLEMTNCRLDEFDIEPIGKGPRAPEETGDDLSEAEKKKHAVDKFESEVKYELFRPADKKRKYDVSVQQDFYELRNALEQYFGDNAEYPASLEALVAEGVITQVPLDSDGIPYSYDVFPEPDTNVENQCYRLSVYLRSKEFQYMMQADYDGANDPNLWETGVCYAKKSFPLSTPPQIDDDSNEQELWPGRIFDFLGDEVAIGVGEEMIFDIQDIDEIDAYLAVLLTDREKAEKFFRLVAETLVNESRGGHGFFQFEELVKKEHSGVEYYSMPVGFLSLYALFEDDRVYFSLSQKSIHSLIDGEGGETESRFHRLDAFLPGIKAATVRADFAKAALWLDAWPQPLREEVAQNFFYGFQEKPYAAEYFLLEQALGADFMKKHFMHQPQILGYTPVWKDKKFQWEKDGVAIDQSNSEQMLAHGTELLESAKAIYTAYGTGGLSFAFTPHGAEIRIAFNNPAQEEADERFVNLATDTDATTAKSKFEDITQEPPCCDNDEGVAIDASWASLLKNNKNILIAGGSLILVLVVFLIFRRRK